MAWEQRLREAAYTSPSGIRRTFTFADVGISIDKKTSAFEFPDVDGTYIQDLGVTGHRIPMRMFFNGDNHDLEADEFLRLLSEAGVGRLEHPRYGNFDVVPFGTISQRDDLVTQGNQSVLEFQFWETVGEPYPQATEDQGLQVINAVSSFNDNLQFESERDIMLDTATNTLAFRGQYQQNLDETRNALSDAIEITQGANPVEAIYNTLNRVLPDEDVTTLAGGVHLMVEATARSGGDINNLFNVLIGQQTDRTSVVREDSYDNDPDNRFYTDNMYAANMVAGMCTAAVNADFSTKTQAIEIADSLVTQFENLQEWTDENLAGLNVLDTGAAYNDLQRAVALTAGYLVQISFTLQQERSIILTRSRAMVDLCGELYGDIDGRLDFFIQTNRLTGSEMIDIPIGRQIVYYV